MEHNVTGVNKAPIWCDINDKQGVWAAFRSEKNANKQKAATYACWVRITIVKAPANNIQV